MEDKMKKSLFALMLLSFTVGSFACGGDKSKSSKKGKSSQSEERSVMLGQKLI